MATVNDLITDAYGEIGIYGPSDTISTADSGFALRRLNSILDTWAAQPSMSMALASYALPVTAGVMDYTVQPRATRIRSAHLLYPATNQLVYPLNIVSRLDYEDLRASRYFSTGATRPDTITYQNTLPTSTLTLGPVPDQNCTVKIWFDNLQFTAAGLSDTLTLSQGYYKALMLQLALELAPSFGAAPSPITQAAWMDAIKAVKRMNQQTEGTPYDQRMPGRHGRFDIISGFIY